MAVDINFIKEKNSLHLKKISSKQDIDNAYDGFLINTKGDEKEARKIVDALKKSNKTMCVMGSDNMFNRRVLETMKVHYLVSPEIYHKRDNLKQRDSGLNHVTATIAAKNKIGIIIDMANLQKQERQEKAQRLARIIQNIDIAKKAKCDIKVASLATTKEQTISKENRKNFLISLGASTQQAKKACVF